MKTVHSINVGRRIVVLRADGQVYVVDKNLSFGEQSQVVASSHIGCLALGEALIEMAGYIKRRGS